MISLHVTVYTTDEGDRFVVHTISSDTGEPVDVTDQYDVVALTGEQEGFAVLKRRRSFIRHPNGTEEDFVPKHTGKVVYPLTETRCMNRLCFLPVNHFGVCQEHP